MAVNNRAEAIIVADATLAPTLTLAQHKTMLKDNILNSVKFDKDVIASETPVAGAVTIDFSNKDMATVTTAVDLVVSFTNLENGAVKYLEVTKSAGNQVSFNGVAYDLNHRKYIKENVTLICYRVMNKNGYLYVESIFTPTVGLWSNLQFEGLWAGTAKYRYDNMNDKIQLYLKCFIGNSFTSTIGFLPIGFRPNVDRKFILASGLPQGFVRVEISSQYGTVYITNPSPITTTTSVDGLLEYYNYAV